MSSAIFVPEILNGIDEELIAESEKPMNSVTLKKSLSIILPAAVFVLVFSIWIAPGLIQPFVGPGIESSTEPPPYHITDNFIIDDGILLEYSGSEEIVDIPDGVRVLSASAFADAPTVRVINLSSSVSTIEEGALSGCENLEELNINGNENFSDSDGVITDRNGHVVYSNRTVDREAVTVPEGVEWINSAAFRNNKVIKEVQLPESLTMISSEAFAQCYALESIDLKHVKTVQEMAFNSAESLKYVDFGDSLIYIGAWAFDGTALTEIRLPATIKTIADYAFDRCDIKKIIYEGAPYQWKNVQISSRAFDDFDEIEIVILGEDPEETPLVFKSNGDGTCTACPSESRLDGGDIIIPERSPAGELVTAIESFKNCENITSIELPVSVTVLPDNAFDSCINLVSIQMPGVKDIGKEAFIRCSSLKSIELPETLTVLRTAVFAGCESLETLTLHEGIEAIESNALSECRSLRELILPSTVKDTLGDGAFYGAGFVKADLSRTRLKIIGGFEGCAELEEIIFPETAEVLAFSAFKGCVSLKKIELHEGFKRIMAGAFDNTGIETLVLPSTLEEVHLNDADNLKNVVFGKDMKVFPTFTRCDGFESLEIPYGFTEIPYGAFYECANLKEIIIPETVTKIGEEAFYGCEKLKTVTIPDSVNTIGEKAFYASGLVSITLPEEVREIQPYAFSECPGLEKVVVQNGLESIPEGAFDGCRALKTVVLSEGLKRIGDSAFNNCQSLQSITLPNSLEELGKRVFAYNSGLERVVLSEKLESIGERCFESCTSLQNVEFPSSLKVIGRYSYASCPSIREIRIPKSVTEVGEGAFSRCDNVETVTVEGGSLRLGRAFSNMSGLKKVVFEGTTEILDSNSFQGSHNLEEVEILDGTVNVPSGCFAYCTELSRIDFTKIRSIGRYGFDRCVSLTVAELNSETEFIEREAFRDCTALESVKWPESLNQMEQEVFKDCTSLREVTLPSTVRIMLYGVFDGCDSLEKICFLGSEELWNDIGLGDRFPNAEIVFENK